MATLSPLHISSSGSSSSSVLDDVPSPRESRFNRLLSKLNAGPASGSATSMHGSTGSRSPSPAMMARDNDASFSVPINPSTPVRYTPDSGTAAKASPALSDIDDFPPRPPVFESRFMRELEMQTGNGTDAATSNPHHHQQSSSLSPRPPLAVSYSSPAAVTTTPGQSSSTSNNGGNGNSNNTTPGSASSSSSGSLKSRLVRVASSSSLFGRSSAFASAPSATAAANNNNNNDNIGHVISSSPSPNHHHNHNHQLQHRKTASMLTGSHNSNTPSPRARLAASLAQNGSSHRHHQSEDVRYLHQLDSTASSPRARHATAPMASAGPALSVKDPNVSHTTGSNSLLGNDRWQKSKESLLSGLGGRKRSIDGLSSLSAASSSTHNLVIPEETDQAENENENGNADNRSSTVSGGGGEERYSVASSHSSKASDETRPSLGSRLLSSENVTTNTEMTSNTTGTGYNLKSTPGFPRVPLYPPPSTSNATNTGISSGLSESSRRFRSAFRLNKSRNGTSSAASSSTAGTMLSSGEAPGTGGLSVRRAMRVPLSQQLQEQQLRQDLEGEQQEQEREAEREREKDDSQDQQEFSRQTARGTPEDGQTSLRSSHANSSNLSSHSPPLHHRDLDSAHERAQLVPSTSSSLLSLPTVPESTSSLSAHENSTASNHVRQTSSLSLRARRAQQQPGSLNNTHGSPGDASSTSNDQSANSPSYSASTSSSSNQNSPSYGSHAQDHDRSANESTVNANKNAAAAGATTHQRDGSYLRHNRTTSRTRLDDLMLVPEPDTEPRKHTDMPKSDSTGSLDSREQQDSDTLLARQQQQQQARTMSGRSRKENFSSERNVEEEVELLLEVDKENYNVHAQSQQQRQYGQQRALKASEDGSKATLGRDSPPMLGARKTLQIHPHQQQQNSEGQSSATAVREGERRVLGEVRRQTSQNALPHVPAAIEPVPRIPQSYGQSHQQQHVPQQPQQRASKLSSSSSNGGLGYHPSDRQVMVNDYAVPTKRGGDTPPDERHQYHGQQQYNSSNGYPSQASQYSSARPAPSLPPTSSLPAPPSSSQQQQQQQQQQQPEIQQQQQQPVRRTTGTVTVKGKTYTRMGLLGRGGSSKVFRVSDRDHQVFALKKVDLGKGADSETYQSFLNEIDLLERLRGHDRIIQLVASEVNEARRSLIMVMEIGEIDLNALLQERAGKRVSVNFIRHTWEQMLEAVNVIHEQGIVHTDLKPANFVLVKGALKLIDFGIAKAIPNDTTNIARDQQIGTANYMSPEALNPHISNGPRGERVMKLGRPSDVWSLGCILYQVVYGHTPFGRIKNLAAKMNAIQTPGYQIDFPSQAVPITLKGELIPELAVRVEEDLLKCIKDCLRYEPKRRATIPELLEDPFLRREGSAEGVRAQQERESEATVSPELMNAIVANTLKWSQGRTPSRGEQERFVEAMVRQLHIQQQQQQPSTDRRR